MPGYLRDRAKRRQKQRPARAWLTIADHFEPYWQRPDDQTADRRVAVWRQRWPEIAAAHRDALGRPPRYTFFYPQEEYRPHILESLAEMTRQGIADVDVHIHHDCEGEKNFLDRMVEFLDRLRNRHGLLREHGGRTVFGFIHGNWALDNARPDGRWCGLNNELTLLRDLGCYADFTLPCVPDPSQAGLVNTIYWATDDPERPRSHSTGVPLVPGGTATGDLLMIPGPLGVSWKGRPPWKPRIETGELAGYARPTRDRARMWLALAPQVGEDVFIKLFSHGAQERNATHLLTSDLDLVFSALREECAEQGVLLLFASAWEMRRAVEAVRLGTDPLAVARGADAQSSSPPVHP